MTKHEERMTVRFTPDELEAPLPQATAHPCPSGSPRAWEAIAALFVLAAVVNHENLGLEETAQVTRLPASLCRIHVERFRELGALVGSEGRFRVSTHWQRAAIRLLRRRNLLAD